MEALITKKDAKRIGVAAWLLEASLKAEHLQIIGNECNQE